jgi:hypothetical protein
MQRRDFLRLVGSGLALLKSIAPAAAGDAGRTRTVPAPFRPIFPRPASVLGAGTGKVGLCCPSLYFAHPDQWRNLAGGRLWVSPRGNDQNDGSESSPLATLQEAFLRPEPNVQMEPGAYVPGAILSRIKRVEAPFGGVTISNPGPELKAQIFRPDSNGHLWETKLQLAHSRAEPHRILRTDRFDEHGYEQPLRRHADLHSLRDSQTGWYFDPVKSLLQVGLGTSERFGDGSLPLRALYLDRDGAGSIRVTGGVLIVDADVTFDGVGLQGEPVAGAPSLISLRGCWIRFAPAAGLMMHGGASYAESVRIHASRHDCFNYGGEVGFERGLAIEHDCRASNAGDIATFGLETPNRNGSSAHGEFDIARFGGIYKHSYGPNIADTGSHGFDAATWNVGVRTESSRIGIGFGVYDGPGSAASRRVWLDSCAALNELRAGLLHQGSSAISLHSCSLGTLEGTGRYRDYQPDSP